MMISRRAHSIKNLPLLFFFEERISSMTNDNSCSQNHRRPCDHGRGRGRGGDDNPRPYDHHRYDHPRTGEGSSSAHATADNPDLHDQHDRRLHHADFLITAASRGGGSSAPLLPSSLRPSSSSSTSPPHRSTALIHQLAPLPPPSSSSSTTQHGHDRMPSSPSSAERTNQLLELLMRIPSGSSRSSNPEAERRSPHDATSTNAGHHGIRGGNDPRHPRRSTSGSNAHDTGSRARTATRHYIPPPPVTAILRDVLDMIQDDLELLRGLSSPPLPHHPLHRLPPRPPPKE
mmetsp:Transcript_2053/g.5087  ORF Transcript_2053/g.5087 Transcript_2053/m.5087 type:complete len:288 (+) Transcript_2053:252-1115(+)